ncbi:MAG: glycosyltransferase [Congregibacter sp.]|nr:glycosyltransferase [Congregibacter sp.]
MTEAFVSLRRLAVFGAYSDHDLYQRNRTLVNTLAELSEQTVYVRPRKLDDGKSPGVSSNPGVNSSSTHGFSAGATLFSRLGRLLSDASSLWSQRSLLRDCDVVFVPYPAYLDVMVLWISGQSRGKLIIVDAFLELHSTVVEDRQLIPRDSLRARLLKAFQRFTLGRADIVLIDTAEQADLLRSLLCDTRARITEVPVGIDETIWTELSSPAVTGRVQVLFWGTFIPLHGVEHIIAAARILNARGVEVDFRLIGDGQTAAHISEDLALSPLDSLGWDRRIVDTDTLRAAIATAHIVLGVFGTSAKAGAVVPYKVHQALACNRPIITRSGSAVSSLVDESAGLIVCPPADPAALADAIEQLVSRLNNAWLPNTRMLYERYLSHRVVKEKLRLALTSGRADRRAGDSKTNASGSAP